MANESLEATLDGSRKMRHLKNYLVRITVDVPYPKEFEYRESASAIAPAVSRALKELRKSLRGKKIREYRIKAVQF